MQAPVTVIIPCYNCATTIVRAVDSVLRQTLLPAEIILVDDASSDGGSTAEVMRKLKQKYGNVCKMELVTLTQNSGPGEARNAGWARASQPYISFLDADDSWHPSKIEIQYHWMDQHPEFAACGHQTMFKETNSHSSTHDSEFRVVEVSFRRMLFSNSLPLRSVMLRNAGLSERFPRGVRHAEDYSLWLTLLCNGKRAAKLALPLAYSYKPEFGVSGLSGQMWKMEQGELRVFSTLYRQGSIQAGLFLVVSAFSLLKFLRRQLIAGLRSIYFRITAAK